MAIRILDVGECGFVGPRMKRLWQDELGADVHRVDTGDQAAQALADGKFDIVLVNRVLAMDGSSGLDVIRDLKSSETSVPLMLVSDKADAQKQAVSLGAVEGFGKSQLEAPETVELVKRVATGR